MRAVPEFVEEPIQCPGCGTRAVSFVPVRDPETNQLEYAPDRCVCGSRQSLTALPPGRLFRTNDGDPTAYWHPLKQPSCDMPVR